MGAPTTVYIEARNLVEGDWIEGFGLLHSAWMWPRSKQMVCVSARDTQLYPPEERVLVRIEDHGEEDG